MKKLLLIAALVAAPAFADNEMAYTTNKLGGNIFFTYSKCVYVKTNREVPNNYYVYSTDQNGNKVLDGCYEYKYPFYLVRWNSGANLSVNVNNIVSLMK